MSVLDAVAVIGPTSFDNNHESAAGGAEKTQGPRASSVLRSIQRAIRDTAILTSRRFARDDEVGSARRSQQPADKDPRVPSGDITGNAGASNSWGAYDLWAGKLFVAFHGEVLAR